MKKLLFVCVVLGASLLFSNNTSAQQVKIGYFNDQELLQLMPGIDKVSAALESFQRDSLSIEYDYTLKDYQRRDSIFKKDSAAMPVKARELAMADINRSKLKLFQWQQYAEQAVSQKSEELLAPFRRKLADALQDVVTEQRYAYVLRADALSPYTNPPLLDNCTIRVAMKLKLDLPKEIEDAWKQANGGGKPAAGTPKKN